jgi:hypothetical protein
MAALAATKRIPGCAEPPHMSAKAGQGGGAPKPSTPRPSPTRPSPEPRGGPKKGGGPVIKRDPMGPMKKG